MKKLHFTYNMQIEYSESVSKCNFTIKCIPKDTIRQKIENLIIKLDPDCGFNQDEDGLRNIQLWGNCDETHETFSFHVEGDAVSGLSTFEEYENTDQSLIFKHAHGLNEAGDCIKRFYENKIKGIQKSTYDTAILIMDCLHEVFTYKAGVTNVNTSAEEAFSIGCGVCQDYAHVLISLFHLAGIPARYVTGFIMGEGETHAWVEFLLEGKWYGIDPTHNKSVDDGYIKIGHGRDAKDCLINKGIIKGGGSHSQRVSVSVQEL